VSQILSRVIADGKGIEVNTSGWRYGLGAPQPTDDVLRLYRDLGGTIVTIGSDSHNPEHLGAYLRLAQDRLRALGFLARVHLPMRRATVLRAVAATL
jgi:histidinol-phosphatase (PHP family)